MENTSIIWTYTNENGDESSVVNIASRDCYLDRDFMGRQEFPYLCIAADAGGLDTGSIYYLTNSDVKSLKEQKEQKES